MSEQARMLADTLAGSLVAITLNAPEGLSAICEREYLPT